MFDYVIQLMSVPIILINVPLFLASWHYFQLQIVFIKSVLLCLNDLIFVPSNIRLLIGFQCYVFIHLKFLDSRITAA